MRALVVFESIWGNTEQIARAIATGLEETMTVDIVDSESAPKTVEGYDLVVVGGPHPRVFDDPVVHPAECRRDKEPHERQSEASGSGSSTSRRPSRRSRRSHSTLEWTNPGCPVRQRRRPNGRLRELGFEIAVKQKSFRVHGYEVRFSTASWPAPNNGDGSSRHRPALTPRSGSFRGRSER